jgi:hypothetical protein
LDDHVALSLLAECAQQRKDFALERVVGRRHLNELALWVMLICNMLVNVAIAMSEPASPSPLTWRLPNGRRFLAMNK